MEKIIPFFTRYSAYREFRNEKRIVTALSEFLFCNNVSGLKFCFCFLGTRNLRQNVWQGYCGHADNFVYSFFFYVQFRTVFIIRLFLNQNWKFYYSLYSDNYCSRRFVIFQVKCFVYWTLIQYTLKFAILVYCSTLSTRIVWWQYDMDIMIIIYIISYYYVFA